MAHESFREKTNDIERKCKSLKRDLDAARSNLAVHQETARCAQLESSHWQKKVEELQGRVSDLSSRQFVLTEERNNMMEARDKATSSLESLMVDRCSLSIRVEMLETELKAQTSRAKSEEESVQEKITAKMNAAMARLESNIQSIAMKTGEQTELEVSNSM